jgi:hypothetical protein
MKLRTWKLPKKSLTLRQSTALLEKISAKRKARKDGRYQEPRARDAAYR